MTENSAMGYLRFVIFVFLLGLVLGCQEECPPIGNVAPDTRFTASASYPFVQYLPFNARFSSLSAWEPPQSKNLNSTYLQIDFLEPYVICAVATKGNGELGFSEWTTEYKISTSGDNNTWTEYTENSNQFKLFTGNTDRNTAVKHYLFIPVLARFIRFIPTQYNNFVALRVEVYGVNAKVFSCGSLPLGVASVDSIPNRRMSSHAPFNASTPPRNGRLGYTEGSSWCSVQKHLLKITLVLPYMICGIATQGDHKSDNWVESYQLQFRVDQESEHYPKDDARKTFDGNNDRDSIVTNHLYFNGEKLHVGTATIWPTSTSSGIACLRAELYGIEEKTACPRLSYGVPYASVIPDHRFTASSSKPNSLPKDARLRASKEWIPNTNSGGWLQIDLGSVVYVCGVATQGRESAYTKTYKLGMSLNNVDYTIYQEKNFTGNTDGINIVTNTLDPPTKTKFIRFYPTSFERNPAMRVDVHGIRTVCSSPFGLESGGSFDSSRMTSSSHSDANHTAAFGRLYGDFSWCSITQANTEYLQVDLGKIATLTGIATQGDKIEDKWVTSYTLKYSINGGTYKSLKVFQGNKDKNSVVASWFTTAVLARYVQIVPQTWNTAICMRAELFGCQPNCLRSLQAIQDTSTSILVTWKICSLCSPSGYKVSINSTVGGYQKEIVTDRRTTSYNWTNLVNSTDYNFTLEVQYNSEFDGFIKYVNLVRTDDKPPSAAPQNLRAVSVSSSEIGVKWSPPPVDEQNGIIIGYKLSYCVHIENCTSPTIKEFKSTSATLTSLGSASNHFIKVLSYTSFGDGPYSDAVRQLTHEINPPSATKMPNVTSEQSETSFNVTFYVEPTTNGYITRYQFQINQTSSSSPITSNIVNATCNSAVRCYKENAICIDTIHGLQQNCKTVYSIRSRVFNGIGAGPFGEAFLLELEPAPIENFKIVKMEATTADLEWTKKPQPFIGPHNYTITFVGTKTYNFVWSGSFIGARTYFPPSDPSKVTFTVTGLYPSTRYTFSLSSKTRRCSTKSNQDVTGETKAAAPPAPTGGTVHRITYTITNLNLWEISAIFMNNDCILKASELKRHAIFVYIHGVNSTFNDSFSLTCEDISKNATEVPGNTKVFILGNHTKYGGPQNNTLENGKSYQVYQCGRTNSSLYGQLEKIAEGTIVKEGVEPPPPQPTTQAVSSTNANSTTKTTTTTTGSTAEPERSSSLVKAILYSGLGIILLIIIVIVVFLIYPRHCRSQGGDAVAADGEDEFPQSNYKADFAASKGGGGENIEMSEQKHIYDNPSF